MLPAADVDEFAGNGVQVGVPLAVERIWSLTTGPRVLI